MKVKFGDLTVRQAKELCENSKMCRGCPIREFCTQTFDNDPCNFQEHELETEIDLPDEEVKEDG